VRSILACENPKGPTTNRDAMKMSASGRACDYLCKILRVPVKRRGSCIDASQREWTRLGAVRSMGSDMRNEEWQGLFTLLCRKKYSEGTTCGRQPARVAEAISDYELKQI
jgi:hypothetical protein